MKKMMLTLAIALVSFVGTAFAKPTDETVNQKVLDAFKTEFASAQNVEWVSGSNYYRAAFVYNDKHVFAYYNTDGEFLGMTRYISSVDLPLSLQISLQKNAAGYWITDLFEVSKYDTTSYYITLENAGNIVVMRSVNGSAWEEFKTVKKA